MIEREKIVQKAAGVKEYLRFAFDFIITSCGKVFDNVF